MVRPRPPCCPPRLQGARAATGPCRQCPRPARPTPAHSPRVNGAPWRMPLDDCRTKAGGLDPPSSCLPTSSDFNVESCREARPAPRAPNSALMMTCASHACHGSVKRAWCEHGARATYTTPEGNASPAFVFLAPQVAQKFLGRKFDLNVSIALGPALHTLTALPCFQACFQACFHVSRHVSMFPFHPRVVSCRVVQDAETEANVRTMLQADQAHSSARAGGSSMPSSTSAPPAAASKCVAHSIQMSPRTCPLHPRPQQTVP